MAAGLHQRGDTAQRFVEVLDEMEQVEREDDIERPAVEAGILHCGREEIDIGDPRLARLLLADPDHLR
jgi:hypothetical protein